MSILPQFKVESIKSQWLFKKFHLNFLKQCKTTLATYTDNCVTVQVTSCEMNVALSLVRITRQYLN